MRIGIISVSLALVTTLSGAVAPNAPERFEFFDEALRLFNAVPEGGDITADKEKRAQLAYGRAMEPLPFVRDYTDKAANDFSVRFDSPGTDDAKLIGFTPGPWIDAWMLDENAVLHLHLKATGGSGPIKLGLLDQSRKRASYDLTAFKADGTWQALKLPLKHFKPEQGFDYAGGIVGCEVNAALPKDAKIWFDDIHFASGGADGIIGVTEKPITQRIAEARQTRAARKYVPGPSKSRNIFAENALRISKGEEVEAANQELLAFMRTEDARKQFGSHFHIGASPYHELLLNYGAKGRVAAGRVTPDTEKAMLEVIWDAARVSDDIANTRNSTWWLLGSENHDIGFKVNCYLIAQVLSHHPEFAGRVYENDGKGNGYGDQDPRFQGEGQWADGKEYTPVDHYKAWTAFFREYLRERAKKGLFVEVRSPHYISAQIGFVSKLHTSSGDREVSELAGMLSDLIWADYVQDSMSGINGGAKTRSSVRTRMSNYLIGILGGPGPNDDTYELPPLLWKLALKRENLGEFAYLSRRPGEEQDIWPRPKGAERALMCVTESRFLYYPFPEKSSISMVIPPS